MIRITPALAICIGVAACASETETSRSNLITLEDYPTTLNLTTLSGAIERIDGCISITKADGSVFVLLFRPGDTLDEIEERLGPLDQPIPVTVSNFNRMETLPDELTAELERRACSGTPIAFGAISKGEWTPAPPAGGAANQDDAANRSPGTQD